MSSTQRVVLTVVICTGLLIVWQYFFAPKRPLTPPGSGSARVGENAKTASKQREQPSSAPSSRPTSRPTRSADDGPIATDIEGRQVVIDHPVAKVVFTDTGGALRHWTLKDPRYQELRDGKLQAVDLVQTQRKIGPWQVLTTFPESDFSVPPNARFSVVKKDQSEVHYRWRSKKVQVDKRYRVDKKQPVIWLELRVKNLTARPLRERLKVALHSFQDPTRSKPGIANPYPRMATGLCYVNQELFRRNVGAIDGTQSGCSAGGCGMGEGEVKKVGEVTWIAADDRYFLTALVPQGEDRDRRCELKLGANRALVESSVLFAEQKIDPGKESSRTFSIFVGPKVTDDLDRIQSAAGGEANLVSSIEFGKWLQVLARPMLWLMKFFHNFVGNWGLAIILLTLVVKGLTLYPTTKSMRSMKRMQKLQPKINALREKYGNDKQRLNTEMMNLYKVHKVSPFGGCLPMLIQMPIWFSLYRTLGNAVELYRSPFFGWINDLTAPDPYYILPILMGIAMFAQQMITPQPMTGKQAKMFKYFMPGMFTVMMLWLPAGLTLYIFVNTLLTFSHQLYLNRTDPDKDKSSSASAPKKVDAEPGSKKPRPRSNRPRRSSATVQSTGAESAPSGGGSKKKRRRRKKKS